MANAAANERPGYDLLTFWRVEDETQICDLRIGSGRRRGSLFRRLLLVSG